MYNFVMKFGITSFIYVKLMSKFFHSELNPFRVCSEFLYVMYTYVLLLSRKKE